MTVFTLAVALAGLVSAQTHAQRECYPWQAHKSAMIAASPPFDDPTLVHSVEVRGDGRVVIATESAVAFRAEFDGDEIKLGDAAYPFVLEERPTAVVRFGGRSNKRRSRASAPGHAIRQHGCRRPPGTLGWSYAIEGTGTPRFRFVTNQHVLVRRSCTSTRVWNSTLGRRIGFTRYAPPYNHEEIWDLALGEYATGEGLGGFGCEGGYPDGVATEAPTMQKYYTVSSISGCREANLLGWATTVAVDVTTGNKHRFQKQLHYHFDKEMEHGDSGSVLAHSRSRKVTGLLFALNAKNHRMGYANPLYCAGWDRAVRNGQPRSVIAPGGLRVPLYRRDPAVMSGVEFVGQSFDARTELPVGTRVRATLKSGDVIVGRVKKAQGEYVFVGRGEKGRWVHGSAVTVQGHAE